MTQANPNKLSILGCGWLGRPLAVHLQADGYLVKGSTTSPEKLPPLRHLGIEAYVASLNPEPKGEHWPDLLDADILIVDIPPRASQQGGAFHPQQMEFLADLIKKSSVSKIIYVSSTSVYPEVNGIVVETDVLEPAQSAAPALLQAETTMLALASAGLQVTILRCGGLMGYDRIPGKYVRGKQNMTTGDIPVNYIHRDDVIGIINALLACGESGGVYNAVAPRHPTRRQVYESSCHQFGWVPPTFMAPATPEPYKIVSSEKIGDLLNYRFHYPDPLAFHYQPA
jgi:nucleoside-diphosphate-sugar epimerase